MKKFSFAVLIATIILFATTSSFAGDMLTATADFLKSNADNPTIASIGGEWTVLGLARNEGEIADEYFESYYSNVIRRLKSTNGMLHSKKHTEYARVVIALTSIGKNPENVVGYNLVAPLLDFEKTTLQGINGSIWALIALDCLGEENRETKNKYTDYILERQKPDGGWSLSDIDVNSDADITAMALTALSAHRDRDDVEASIKRAIELLSKIQNQDGGYTAYNTNASESTAQVLTAISSLGISYEDERFVKNGKTLIDNILSFRHTDGSFSHSNEPSIMATEQCFYALVAAKRLENGKTPLFDMSDVEARDNLQNQLYGKNENVVRCKIKFPGKSFEDVFGDENKKVVEALGERGIINGREEALFYPNDTMTRAEIATIVTRALGLEEKKIPVFDDVKSDNPFFGYVGCAQSFGIIKGTSEKNFNPTGTISRQEAAVMIERASRLCGIQNSITPDYARDVLCGFSDYTKLSDWASNSVAFCFDNNILPDDVLEIAPQEAVTRLEIAHMIYNMLDIAMLL